MKVTTIDIIKFLPFEKNFQDYLINNYEKLDPDKKYEVGSLLWDTYEAIHDLKIQDEIEKALIDTKNSNIKLDDSFYSNIKQKVAKEMEEETFNTTATTDISSIREKLAQIMKK